MRYNTRSDQGLNWLLLRISIGDEKEIQRNPPDNPKIGHDYVLMSLVMKSIINNYKKG